ncbi:CPBP family intramembrane metalloprotease [Candidatus Shapirobacteria bacterium]|nr:CPBP family intramembrane metalloprotease [Candidatus Shapirobacteria bacterium]
MEKPLRLSPCWNYLDGGQRELLSLSRELLEKERTAKTKLHDYSFVVFPAAKAYEGFLKKLFFDIGFISENDYRGDRFRIGRALNPSLGKNYWAGSLYEHLKGFCGGEALPQGLWQTWKKSRNLLFHYFLDEKNAVSLGEAEQRLKMIEVAIGAAFIECHPHKERLNLFAKRQVLLKRAFWLYGILLVFWGFYRFLLRLPEPIEELVLKPIIWLGPTFGLVALAEKRPLLSSLGFGKRDLAKNIYWGAALGMFFSLFALTINFFKYGTFDFIKITPAVFWLGLAISLFTAISEEVVFRGYLLHRLFEALRNEWQVVLLSSLGFVVMHLPMVVFGFHYGFAQIYTYSVLVFFYSLGAGILFLRTGNIIAPILMHLFWSWPIILFR